MAHPFCHYWRLLHGQPFACLGSAVYACPPPSSAQAWTLAEQHCLMPVLVPVTVHACKPHDIDLTQNIIFG